MTQNFLQEIQEPSLYLQALHKLKHKLSATVGCYGLQEQDVEFMRCLEDDVGVAKLLANAVRKQEYQFRPVRCTQIVRDGKQRQVYPLQMFDRIVQMAWYQALMDQIGSTTLPCIYSYIPGRSAKQACHAFSKYIQQKRCLRTSHLDLFVFRTDIKSYTDSISLTDTAPLWPILKQGFLKMVDLPETAEPPAYEWSLLMAALRPQVLEKNGTLSQLCLGIPMGSPIGTWAAIAYLEAIDQQLTAIPGIFYARYGDDLLLAHPEAAQMEKILEQLKPDLAQLGLRYNEPKTQRIYLTRCGRPSPEPNYQGVHFVDYVGYRIYGDGHLSAQKKHIDKFKVNLLRRIRNLEQLTRTLPLETRAKVWCEGLHVSLDIRHPMHDSYLVSFLEKNVNDGELLSLDFWIAQKIASRLTGVRGIQGLHTLGFKKIRKMWGLQSLQWYRNRFYRLRFS